MLLRDRDTKFGPAFDETLKELGITPVPIAYHAPAMNAYAERFIGTLKRECLERFVVLGTGHLDHIVAEFTRYYNEERPHMGLGLRTPSGPSPPECARPPTTSEIRCEERLGGLLRHYHRKAA
jgi:transposase InsO family protein